MPNEGSGAPASAVVTTPPAVVIPPAVVPPPSPPVEPDENAPWLKARLERAERAALEKLGITDPVKAKELIAAANKAEQDAKTAAEKLGETSGALKAAQAEVTRQQAITTEFAARMMMGLTAEQQAAVKSIAGEDAATQLKTITALTPTWAAAGTPAGGTPPAPKPSPVPATPATGTAPPPVAPPPAPGSPPDHAAVYAELYKTNPFAAAQYGLEHAAEVFKTPT